MNQELLTELLRTAFTKEALFTILFALGAIWIFGLFIEYLRDTVIPHKRKMNEAELERVHSLTSFQDVAKGAIGVVNDEIPRLVEGQSELRTKVTKLTDTTEMTAKHVAELNDRMKGKK